MNIKPGDYYVCSCGNAVFTEERRLLLSRREDSGAHDLRTSPATPLEIYYSYRCTNCHRVLERKRA